MIAHNPHCSKVSYNLNERIIISNIDRLIQIHLRNAQQKEDYCKLPMRLFYQKENLKYNLYIKINDEKYIKIFNKVFARIFTV